MFIQLTHYRDREVKLIVNVDRIDYITYRDDSDYCTIYFTGESRYISVSENIEEIKLSLEKSPLYSNHV